MPVICCMECGKELTFSDFMERNVISLKDIDFKKVGIFCREHGEQVKLKLEEKRFVEEYKGNKIYCKDGHYVPYWGCSYYFKSLEDVRHRIDASTISILY